MTANALAWLNDLMQWLGKWIPRLVLVHGTHRGVLFGPKGGVRQAGPGLVFYWPITHDMIEVPVTMQSIQLVSQMMPMKQLDGIPAIAGIDATEMEQLVQFAMTRTPGGSFPQCVFVTLNVQFSITSPIKAATKVLYFHALVSNKASSCAMREWLAGERNLYGKTEWLDTAREKLTAELEGFGIKLECLELAGMAPGVAVKQMSDWTWSDTSTGTRPKD